MKIGQRCCCLAWEREYTLKVILTSTDVPSIGGFYAFILGRNENVELSVVARSNYEQVKKDVSYIYYVRRQRLTVLQSLKIESANHGDHTVNIKNGKTHVPRRVIGLTYCLQSTDLHQKQKRPSTSLSAHTRPLILTSFHPCSRTSQMTGQRLS